jgi:hypothetical protein
MPGLMFICPSFPHFFLAPSFICVPRSLLFLAVSALLPLFGDVLVSLLPPLRAHEPCKFSVRYSLRFNVNILALVGVDRLPLVVGYYASRVLVTS